MVPEPRPSVPTIPKPAAKPKKKPTRPSGWTSLEGLRKVVKAGVVLSLIGAVAILAALLVEARHSGRTGVLVSLLEKVGEALVIAGAIDIVIHLRDWSDYFMERLRDAIVHESYLKKLDTNALKDLIGRAFRAQLDNPSISADNKAGFLDYFFTDIQQFIGEPFRENVVAELTARKHADGFLLIEDNLTYICRESKGVIQEHVRWSNTEGEHESIAWLRISVKRSDSREESVLYDSKVPAHLQRKPLSTPLLVEEKIDDKDRVDGLLVTVGARYIIRPDRFQYWSMSHLTKNISLLLRFPEDYEVQVATFGMKEESLTKSPPGIDHCTLRYTSWLLPDTGISWTFNERRARRQHVPTDSEVLPAPAPG